MVPLPSSTKGTSMVQVPPSKDSLNQSIKSAAETQVAGLGEAFHDLGGREEQGDQTMAFTHVISARMVPFIIDDTVRCVSVWISRINFW